MESDVASEHDIGEEHVYSDVEEPLFEDPDLTVVGFDRYSDGISDLPNSPNRAAEVAAAVDPVDVTQPYYSDISPASSPSVVPETDVTPASSRPLSPVVDSEPDVEFVNEEAAPEPPRLPPIQPADILAAVRCTTVDRAAAVAARLAANHDLGHLHDVMPVMVIMMQAARADLARTLLDERIQHEMAGSSAEATLIAGAIRLLNIIAGCQCPGLVFQEP